MRKALLIVLLATYMSLRLNAEDGYRLWLRYDRISNPTLLSAYRSQISSLSIEKNSPTLTAAHDELLTGLEGLLGMKINLHTSIINGTLLIGTPNQSKTVANNVSRTEIEKAGKQGFVIKNALINGKKIILVAANTDIGLLYGSFHFIRLLQTGKPISNLHIISSPLIENRILNHWDNLNRTVERGYAGSSIWDWHRLPGYIDQRYKDYARANASIGINGTVLTNVNANALVLSGMYLEKCAALAATFRPYGIRVYLTARFSAPVELGGLKTADPLDEKVKQWWKDKAAEIYRHIPDFGGFLVKANSEGQPGPQNYGRTHADGANMLADAVAPFGGIVMWRAFVYSNETPDDRFKQAYNEFKPLDGLFRKNVVLQVKNGPIDFQPREPFHPLFGAMKQTPLMMEFQITQEYLGQATHLVFLPVMFKEVLDADTYINGKGSTVAKFIDGSSGNQNLSAMAGVANIGSDRNWTGHPFGQANWYGYGRLAWDHRLSSTDIAEEWIRQTFTNDAGAISTIKNIMLRSHEMLVNYMTPLGLNHIMGNGHHYGPSPWSANLPRADWNPVYYHRADSAGIGFDRTSTGSNALSQYAQTVRTKWENIASCPEEYLLWFHHVSWNHKMKSGRTLWEELCYKYNEGVDSIQSVQRQWKQLSSRIDKQRFAEVAMLLGIQVEEATWWRDACLSYFQTFSRQPIPRGVGEPRHSLDYYKSLRFPYAPGN
ncbi:MAG: alpha-glucuronidase [Chitinophagaceae bacterium]|nr:alpha-glucuronidase [Chitinophagaceae bacterium]